MSAETFVPPLSVDLQVKAYWDSTNSRLGKIQGFCVNWNKLAYQVEWQDGKVESWFHEDLVAIKEIQMPARPLQWSNDPFENGSKVKYANDHSVKGIIGGIKVYNGQLYYLVYWNDDSKELHQHGELLLNVG